MIATEDYMLDRLNVGESVLVPGDYSREFHVRVSNRMVNYVKSMGRKGVPLRFITRRARTTEHGGDDRTDGVVIQRVEFATTKRKKRKKKLVLQGAIA